MEAKAVGRYLRVTPRKARYVLDTVRGKTATEALALLEFLPHEAAGYIRHLVESAIANAEHNYAMDREALRICRAYVDQGPSLKRIRPRAMGRAFRILKRTSHITVVVTEDEALKKAAAKPKGRRPSQRKKEAAEAVPAEPKAPTKRRAAKPKAKAAEPEAEAVSTGTSSEEGGATPSPTEEQKEG